MTARRASHQDKVKNAYEALQAMQEEQEAQEAASAKAARTAQNAEEPPSDPPATASSPSADTEPPQAEETAVAEEAAEKPGESPTEPPASEGAQTPAASPVPPQHTRTPRQPKTPRTAKPSVATADEAKPSSNNKIRFTVAMDSDLINLMSLARVAFPGGKTIAQIFFAAARRHARIAADLPDTPLVQTVLDDKYDDIVTQAAHRTPYTGYVKPKAYAALAADAFAAGLESSDFVRRTVRRYLAVEHAFVPAVEGHLLTQSSSFDTIVEELKVQINSGRPAVVLPTPGGVIWAAVELPEGTPLRALTDEALATMPGCMSATQALLTVL